jgi:zinc protease
MSAAFRVHSYHHEVIGDMADLETMTRDDLYAHYRKFYAPNNAIVVVVGDFKSRAMLARITELFGKHKPQAAPDVKIRTEPEQKGERRVHLSGEGETAFVEMAFHAPQATHDDFIPLVALDSILGGASSLNPFGSGLSNRSSRLYRALVETGLARAQAGASHRPLTRLSIPSFAPCAMTVRPRKSKRRSMPNLTASARSA